MMQAIESWFEGPDMEELLSMELEELQSLAREGLAALDAMLDDEGVAS